HPCGGQECGAVGDKGDEMVGTPGQGRVVEGPFVLGDPDRFGTHLHDEGLGDGAELFGGGDSEAAVGEPFDVLVATGEGHHRVQGHRKSPDHGGGGQDPVAVRATGVRDEGATHVDPGRGQPRGDLGEFVVGDGEQDQVAGFDHLRGVEDPGGGQALCDVGSGTFGNGGRRDDLVPGATEGLAEDGTDPAGADDSDAQPRRTLLCRLHPCVSSCSVRPACLRTVTLVHTIALPGGSL